MDRFKPGDLIWFEDDSGDILGRVVEDNGERTVKVVLIDCEPAASSWLRMSMHRASREGVLDEIQEMERKIKVMKEWLA